MKDTFSLFTVMSRYREEETAEQFLAYLTVWGGDGSDPLYLAFHPQTPSERLDELAAHSDVAVAAAVAGNASTPVEALISLTDHSNFFVLRELAGNPALPVAQLLVLARKDYRENSLSRQILTAAVNRSPVLSNKEALATYLASPVSNDEERKKATENLLLLPLSYLRHSVLTQP